MYEVNSYYQNDYKIVSKRETIYKNNNAIVLNIESEVKECRCPKCGTLCKTSYIGRYERCIEDVPYNFQSIWLHVHAHKFECMNPNCEKKYFDEVLPFARKNKVKTDNFIQFILTLSIFMSASATSLILSLLGTSVSADIIDSIISKIAIKDNVNVEDIGVDDVSKRKGQTYLTAIYDLSDHHLIALLEGRDAESFKEWLKKHPKVKVVARDRANAYAAAINEILPNCTQVADRFHLFQNLIEYLKDIFYKEIPDKIFIKEGVILDKVPKKVAKEIADIDEGKLASFTYDNSAPINENGEVIIFNNKSRDVDSKQYKEDAEARINKKKLIMKVRNDLKDKDKKDYDNIAKDNGICKQTLIKYKNMTKDEVKNFDKIHNYKKGKTKMDNYMNIIYKMLKDNIPQEYIFAYVKSNGYDGSDRYLFTYINMIARNNGFDYKIRTTFITEVYPSNITIITKYELLKYLLTLDENKKKNLDIERNAEIIFKKYPIAKQVQVLFKDFHYVMFSANPDNLDLFIDIYNDLIPSFCNGIKKDIAPVKNAISYEINSGFVEGNNNKFKLIKRILYGKSNLVNLFKKCYLGFMSTLDTFDISLIVEDVLNS